MNLYDDLWSKNWQNVQKVGPLTYTRYRLMLNELPPTIPEGTRIIDVGCGNGTFLGILKEKYPNVVLCGVEYSQQARQVANKNLQEIILIGDIVEIAPQLAKDPYDIVICSEVLEHVEDPLLSLKAITSLLKPDGLGIFTVPGGMRYWSKQDEVAGHYRRFEYDEFANLIQDSGLRVERHYGWGTSFARIYDQMVSWIGPEQVMKSGNSVFSSIVSKMLITLFRIDDLLISPNGFQLITKVRRLIKE